MRPFLNRLSTLFASHGLACALLIVLFVLTYVGTIAQIDLGLHEAQKRYFDAFFVATPIGPMLEPFGIHLPEFFDRLRLPLPGGQLVLILLGLNLIWGGIVRMRQGVATAGILVAHIGLVWMFVAGGVEYLYSDKGALSVYEGDTKSTFVDHYAWEIAIQERVADGKVRELVVPAERFDRLHPQQKAIFHHDSLPFVLEVTRFVRNSQPSVATSATPAGVPVVDGFYLREIEPSTTAESNTAGVYVRLMDKETRTVTPGILWGMPMGDRMEYLPWTVTSGKRQIDLVLRKKTYPLPFAIRLTKFSKENHPGITMARAFSSKVVKIEGENETGVLISMNEPLRHKGYTLFQSSWFPQDEAYRGPVASVFSVVRNPADQWPLYSCLIIAVGLVFHFGRKLLRFLRAEMQRTAEGGVS
ncbi:MAG: cytochrome c biogenesis protein ResB [Planctomycetes bacterium]|nr:cytochrome c biogenesis protein ResB [Planctomycetota bacterium]